MRSNAIQKDWHGPAVWMLNTAQNKTTEMNIWIWTWHMFDEMCNFSLWPFLSFNPFYILFHFTYIAHKYKICWCCLKQFGNRHSSGKYKHKRLFFFKFHHVILSYLSNIFIYTYLCGFNSSKTTFHFNFLFLRFSWDFYFLLSKDCFGHREQYSQCKDMCILSQSVLL